MAKGKKKGSGPGRGRKNPPRDPETGRLLGKEAGGAAPVSSPAAAPAPPKPSAPEMTPAGKTEMPEEIKKEISGFRKAMSERLKEMGETESGVQETVLDGLRNTAERLVQQNEDIFGKKGEKTVDQSAAYEIIEGVVALSEQAAAAKTVEQKRKILQRLKTYKTVVEKVIVGKDPRLSAISGKILEMIESIETPLSKESGMMASAKEKITDFAKKIPEKLARKIPLVGGLLGGYLQRRREKKEEEAAALSDLTQQISKAGRTSLYGKAGKGGFGSGEEGGVETEPPIPGTTPLSEIMSPESSGGGFGIDKQIKQNIQSIKNDLGSVLSHIKEIKEFILGRFDPAQEETKAEEAKRENEDMLFDMMSSLKGDKGKIEKGGAAVSTKSGGIMDMLMNAMGGGAVSAELISALAGIALPVVGVLAAAAGGAAIGWMLYKNWIEPALDKSQKQRDAVLAKKAKIERTKIKTDKGENVYSVEHEDKTEFLTEQEIKEKLKTASPEEKVKLESAMARGPIEEVVDVEAGKTRVDPYQHIRFGQSIEEMRKAEEEVSTARVKDPGKYRYDNLKKTIAKFDQKVRTEWKEMSSDPEFRKSSVFDAHNPSEIKAKLIKSEANQIYKQITKEQNNPLSKDQQQELLDLSPIVGIFGKKAPKMFVKNGILTPDLGGSAAEMAISAAEVMELDSYTGTSRIKEKNEDRQPQKIKDILNEIRNPKPSSSLPSYAQPSIPPTGTPEKPFTSEKVGGSFGGFAPTTENVPSVEPSSSVGSVSAGTPVPSASMANGVPSTSTSLSTPPVQGKIEPKPLSDSIGASTETNPIKAQIDTIRVEMNKLDTQASRISPPVSLEEMNQINSKRKELNTKRQELYKKLYANTKPSESPTASISAPSTPSTDVGKATASLERARNDVEMAQATQSAPPANQTLVSTNNSGNTSTVNITNPAPTGVRNPDAINADRGLH